MAEYVQMPYSVPTTVIVTNTTVQYGPHPQVSKCQYCNEEIKTTVKAKATTKTHLVALLLCCCLCWPCVCLPYCMKSCQNRSHYCPNCEAFLGNYES